MAFMQRCKPSHEQTYCGSEQGAFNASSYEYDSQSSEYEHQEYGKQCSPQHHGGYTGQHLGGHTGQHLGGHTGQHQGGHTGQHLGGHTGQHHGGHMGEMHRHSGSKKYSEQDWSETDKFSAYGYNADGNAFGSCLEKKEEHDSYRAVKNSKHKHSAYRKKHGNDSCSDSESDDEDCRRKC